MDFFTRQDKAQSATKELIGLFGVAVATVAAATTAVLFAAYTLATKQTAPITGATKFVELSWMQTMKITYMRDYHLWWGLCVLIAFALSMVSLIKAIALSHGGGRALAESLGGRLVAPGSANPAERKVLNVVEEMALASGTPVPPLYIIDNDESINAFAAGFKPGDAVIGVTKGAVEKLTRDELQGVVAHEFSHIVHGDMRLNSQLIGAVFGLLGVALVGRFVLNLASRGSGKSSDNNGSALYFFVVGGTIMLIGYVGHLAGELIRRAICRQREFLADAAATQYTRNPQGLARALLKAGEHGAGSGGTPALHQLKHMFFVEAVKTHLDSLTATHPPLAERVKALGSLFAAAPGVRPIPAQAQAPRQTPAMSSGQFLAALPAELTAATRDPYAARAVVFCALLDADEQIKSRQMQSILGLGDTHLAEVVGKLAPMMAGLGAAARIPVVDLTFAALKQLSQEQLAAFLKVNDALIQADGKVDLFEYTLVKMLKRRLTPGKLKTGGPTGKQVAGSAAVVLSAVASAGDPGNVGGRFQKAAERLAGAVGLQVGGAVKWDLGALDAALGVLGASSPAIRSRLVEACAHCAADDGRLTIEAAELVRATADALEVTMPSFLVWPIGAGVQSSKAA